MGKPVSDERIEDKAPQSKQDKQQPAEDEITVQNGEPAAASESAPKEEQTSDNIFQVTVTLPHQPYEMQISVSPQEQVQDLRQTIVESPSTFQYSCFHLEHKGDRINDFVELSEVKGLAADSEIKLIEDPYTEKEARLHLLRIREIIGIASDRTDTLHGILAGVSLHDTVCPWKASDGTSVPKDPPATGGASPSSNALADYSFDGPPSLKTLLPVAPEQPPKTIKSLGMSAWNPPPPHLRQQGHLLYLQLTTNEGEQYQITSHASGFFVNKSSNSKFDPFPRASPKNVSAHSLFSLISNLSPSFSTAFDSLLQMNNKRDPLTNFGITNAVPSSPWLVSPASASLSHHTPDLTRTQETYLMAGVEGTGTLRDWNEEIQSTKELPRETVQDRVFRERLISKIYAEFTDAAARGAVSVANGEVPPLNPTESKDAQIFVYNNVFYSFGADGVGTFTSEGGDEAARVAVGKDVSGVKAVNQLDVPGLATAGTIIVDYMGKRLVAQSIVPGIFKQREPEEYQVDYGGVEGRDIVADNEAFVPTFAQVSKALRVKAHTVWDKEGKKHHLEGSVETKGLLGTDGRKYILDLYRLTPLDILWIEEHWSEDPDQKKDPQGRNYPHRMTVLRQELVESYWRLKMGEYVKEEVDKRKNKVSANGEPRASTSLNGENHEAKNANGKPENGGSEDGKVNGHDASTNGDGKVGSVVETGDENSDHDRVDISAFSLSLNPDAFCGQVPQTDEEKEEWSKDESEVRAVCEYLHQKVLPELLQDMKENDVGFPMDGHSLSRLLHKRGINIRYLGKLALMAEDEDVRLRALKVMAIQEMIARAFKHIAHRYLKNLPAIFAPGCLAHLLNCLLGAGLNKSPKASIDEDLRALHEPSDFAYASVTPKDLAAEVEAQVYLRYRYRLGENWTGTIRHIQMLRSIALKLGLQIIAKSFRFSTAQKVEDDQPKQLTNGASNGVTNGNSAHATTNGNAHVNGGGKKKKKHGNQVPPATGATPESPDQELTFTPDDIANVVPIIKEACPKSVLAEEAFEAGRISLMQDQREIGQELLLESLTLYEQIYGILHPEVARAYHQLALLYSNLEERNAAIELAHKAVIISERTLGMDSSETIMSYLNLGLFEHHNRNTTVAVACVRHALELWKIIYGPNHPDSITTLNNAAVMLQQLHLYPESRKWFEVTLAISEEMSGKSSVNTATLLFQLAQALVLDGDHKGAVQRMRESYSVFNANLGPNHNNTKEAEKWLEQLTQNAVSMAKHAKDVQARRIRRVLFNPRVSNMGAHAQPQVGQSQADLVNGRESRPGGLDPRSIDELMKFIEGGGDITKKTPAKKRNTRANPRRRGGSTVGSTA